MAFNKAQLKTRLGTPDREEHRLRHWHGPRYRRWAATALGAAVPSAPRWTQVIAVVHATARTREGKDAGFHFKARCPSYILM